MLGRLVFVAVLAVGVQSTDPVSEQQQQQMKAFINLVCKKSNAVDKAPQVEAAVKSFGQCVLGMFDTATLRREVEEAKPNGALDEVFKKYCAKTPQLKACIHTVITGVTPCIPADFRDHIATAENATDKLLDFACYKDGDRIALFIAEEGPQCFQSQANEIRNCTTLIKAGLNLKSGATLGLADRCAKFDQLSTCVVTALERCPNPTPANMAESLFKLVRTVTPCNDIKKTDETNQ